MLRLLRTANNDDLRGLKSLKRMRTCVYTVALIRRGIEGEVLILYLITSTYLVVISSFRAMGDRIIYTAITKKNLGLKARIFS
ncbi:hypothetical protein NIES267_37920 [Calothrix parasitica NIES-267]|uniref:Uncharacterized protein n=1 Tax=Calothrix parasitica NIES-267 TaxID=1973488 RepID=A0A1Z4LST6_9CYAN|nr:hypothetical protein NIES267_37920 [Calothrix parasitica NIES-267]